MLLWQGQQQVDDVLHHLLEKQVSRAKELDYENFRRVLYLAQDSPSGLRWKIEIRSGGKHNNVVRAEIDGIAGSKSFQQSGKPHGWQVTYQGVNYAVHRLVVLLRDGELPSETTVDHFDGDPFNNSHDNLRVSSDAHNMRNRVIDKQGAAGRGVFYECKPDGENEYFCAHVTDLEGRLNRKRFSIRKLGYERAMEAAQQWRAERIAELNTRGAGYTDRHLGDNSPTSKSPL